MFETLKNKWSKFVFCGIYWQKIVLCLFQEENSTFQDEGNGVSFSVTPRSPSKAHQMPLEGYHECPPMNQTSSPQLNLPNTLLPSERHGRAEPAGMVPIRCLSPNSLDCSLEERTQVVDENSYVSLCSTLLQEVKLDDSIQHEVRLTVWRKIKAVLQ